MSREHPAHLDHYVHDHGVDPGVSEGEGSTAVSRIRTAFFLNLAFTVAEIVGGILTNSMAILSNAVHDLGDSFALGTSWALERVSGKQRTARFSYGYRRYSLLSALINSVILVVGSVVVLTHAIPRLFHPETVSGTGMVVFAVVGVAVNGIAMLRMRGGRKLNERTVMLHFLEDTLGWVAVLLGGVVMRFASVPILDPILSIAITAYVLVKYAGTVRHTMRIFLQAVPQSVDVEDIVRKIKTMGGVQDVHDVHVWTRDGLYNVLTVHVVVSDDTPLRATSELKSKVREMLLSLNIHHSTIEIGRESDECGLERC